MANARKPQPRASEIGSRLRMIRRRRGLTQDVVAGLAGISKPYLSQLENGLRAFERRSLFERLAAALDCSITDLTGEPYLPVDRQDAEGMAAIPGLEQGLHDCTLDDVPDIPARPVAELVAAVRVANEHRDQVHYALAGRDIGAILTELQVTVATGTADDRRAALAALVELGIVSYEIAKNLGHVSLAMEAAERGYAAAELLGDPALLGFAGWYRALALMRIGAPRRAKSSLTAAARLTEPLVNPASPDTLGSEVHGLVHLTSAAHAARQGRQDDVHSHLDEARQIANAAGERNSLRQHFGPTNVALWSVSIGVELCEGAVLAETKVDPLVLGSHNRTAGFHFDLARALSQEGGKRDREAIQHLDAADRIAPSRIRHDPIARSLLDSLEARTRASMWELSSLRHRWGVEAARG
jgi:transcriptional regulator with XRE-family HTH domain